ACSGFSALDCFSVFSGFSVLGGLSGDFSGTLSCGFSEAGDSCDASATLLLPGAAAFFTSADFVSVDLLSAAAALEAATASVFLFRGVPAGGGAATSAAGGAESC